MMPEFTSVGDYARQLVERRQNADIRTRLNALTDEMATGLKSNLAREVRGDFTRLAAFEREIADLDSYRVAASEVQTRLDAAQLGLAAVQDATDAFSGTLITVPEGQGVELDVMAEDARQRFASVTSALNTSIGGRSVFSGVATDQPALAAPESMMAELETIVAAQPDAMSAEAAIRAWFSPSGGFDTLGFLGDATPVPDQRVGPNDSIGLPVTASDIALRDSLAGLAVAALSGSGPMATDASAQRQLLKNAGLTLLEAQQGLVDLRGGIGAREARLEEVQTRNAAEETALRISRSAMTDADPFETATELEQTQRQLELLYAITARNSRLTLVSAL